MIGDRPAGLLYVSSQLVNFKVPMDTPEAASIALRVVHNGVSSAPLSLPVALREIRLDGFERAKLELEQPAYAGMPIWLKVTASAPRSIHYPYGLGQAGFGCNVVELRRNGMALPERQGIDWKSHIRSFTGNACGSPGLVARSTRLNRLPLHLLYDFSQPGTHEVRLGLVSGPSVGETGAKFSAWTPIQILPAPAGARAAFLRELRDNAPTDPLALLTDTLPNLLGYPDQTSFEILTGYLYNPDGDVRRYAMHGLFFWPRDFARTSLLDVLRSRGPSDVLTEYLNRSLGIP